MGILVLLYHLYAYTHYTAHGGSSYNGNYCGIFFINVAIAASHANWPIGAALE